jgi:hypothetical protein
MNPLTTQFKKILADMNPSYNHQHTVTISDVSNVLTIIMAMENQLGRRFLFGGDSRKPEDGDIIEYTDKYGKEYKHAHLQTMGGEWTVCEEAYIPFVGLPSDGKVTTNASGGSWHSVEIARMEYVGTASKRFIVWGHSGACANGGVEFPVTVNVWRYVETPKI